MTSKKKLRSLLGGTLFMVLMLSVHPTTVSASAVGSSTVMDQSVETEDQQSGIQSETQTQASQDSVAAVRASQNGWVKAGDGGWYFYENGQLKTGWLYRNGNWYWLDPDRNGRMAENSWFTYDNNFYYAKGDGAIYKNGFQEVDGNLYYFQSWGGIQKNVYLSISGKMYYVQENGIVARGIVRTMNGHGDLCAFDDTTGAQITQKGWLKKGTSYYWVREDGVLQTGWLLYDDNWYWFDDNGVMMASGWKEINNNLYYFRSWGGIYKNGWQEVDGKTYYFRSWGGIYKDTYIDGYYVDKNGVRRNSKNICVAIDAGHQRRGNSEKEPIGPGSSTYKAKVASGTCGVATGINEYELNLAVSLKVRDILEERGYDVYMIRETHDVNISNSERAKLAAQNGADILVRVHANGDSNQSVYGALTMAPSSRNTYLSGDVISKSQKLSQKMIAAFCKDTGAKNRDVIYTDSMSGINWSTIPVTIIELGFMSNPSEDRLMATEDYRNKMAQGIADGIDAYYE